ncbi:hypothetical protein J5751_06945 [bacterium]|nr:hypothetical protein [bacterium]
MYNIFIISLSFKVHKYVSFNELVVPFTEVNIGDIFSKSACSNELLYKFFTTAFHFAPFISKFFSAVFTHLFRKFKAFQFNSPEKHVDIKNINDNKNSGIFTIIL